MYVTFTCRVWFENVLHFAICGIFFVFCSGWAVNANLICQMEVKAAGHLIYNKVDVKIQVNTKC